LIHGVAVVNVVVLVSVTTVAYAAAWFAFERRDLRA
jgi:ABC-type transport system involved in multi-copper enzyme maturation permease subunit